MFCNTDIFFRSTAGQGFQNIKARFKRQTDMPNLTPILQVNSKTISSTVDSAGGTLHVPNLIRGEKK